MLLGLSQVNAREGSCGSTAKDSSTGPGTRPIHGEGPQKCVRNPAQRMYGSRVESQSTRKWFYCICVIRCRGYYLFHHAILCGFYSRAATNREQRLLNSVVWVKVFCKSKGFEKSQFYKFNKEFRRGDLVLKQNFQLSLDQSSLSYKAVSTWHLQSVY